MDTDTFTVLLFWTGVAAVLILSTCRTEAAPLTDLNKPETVITFHCYIHHAGEVDDMIECLETEQAASIQFGIWVIKQAGAEALTDETIMNDWMKNTLNGRTFMTCFMDDMETYDDEYSISYKKVFECIRSAGLDL